MTDVIDLRAYGVSAGDYGGPPSAGAGSGALGVLALDELRKQARSMDWVVKHVVPTDLIGVLFGGPGVFKSFIALDLALHVAHGLPWLGRKTKQGRVLIIAAEGGTGLWRRILAWHRAHALRYEGVEVYVLPVAVDLAQDAALVAEAVVALGVRPELVVVDTLSQTFSGEENSAGEISAYLREITLWLRNTWRAAVLLIHHTGHAATERPRGSSALRANVDFMFGVFRDEREMLATVECTKQKDGELIDPVSFALKVVDLAVDEDGDTITSLVATATNGTADTLATMDHEAERGRGGRNHLFLDLALNGIEEKKLRMLFCESIDGEAETKKKAYFRAKRWAVSAGIIEFAQGVTIRLR